MNFLKKLVMFKKVHAQADVALTKIEEILSIPASMLMNKKNLFQLYVPAETARKSYFSI
jgi:hypothetical protein